MLRSAGEGSSVRERVKQFEIDRSAEHAGTTEVYCQEHQAVEIADLGLFSCVCPLRFEVVSSPFSLYKSGADLVHCGFFS